VIRRSTLNGNGNQTDSSWTKPTESSWAKQTESSTYQKESSWSNSNSKEKYIWEWEQEKGVFIPYESSVMDYLERVPTNYEIPITIAGNSYTLKKDTDSSGYQKSQRGNIRKFQRRLVGK